MAPHAAPEHVFAHPIHPFHPLKLADHSADDSPVRHFTYQTENVPLSAASMKQRFSRSRSLSRQSQRTANPQPLADFTEESSSGPGSEETEEAHTLIRHSSVHHFSRAEHELSDLDPENDALSSSVQALHRNPLPAQNRSRTASAPVAPIKPGMPRSYSYHGHSLAESSQVTTHVDRHSSSESELTSPIDETAPGSANGLSKRKLPRSITANAVTALTRNSRSRTRRGPSLALDHGKAIAQQGKALDRRDASNSLAISTLRREKDTQEALARHAFAVRSAEDALATMQEALFQRLPQTLQEMADQV